MAQVHKRFSDEQVAFLFHAYAQGLMSRVEVQQALAVGKARYFALWKGYHSNPQAFSVSYQRATRKRISPQAEAAVESELLREKALIEDDELPISGYNYSAVRDLG